MFYYSFVNADEKTRCDFLSLINDTIEHAITKDQPFKELLNVGLGDDYVELVKEYKNIHIEDTLYNQLTPNGIKEEHIFSFILVLQSIRLGALLHDIGHPPFSHIAEQAIKEVWGEICQIPKNDRTERQKLFIEATNFFEEGKHQLHEQIGIQISSKLIKYLRKKPEDTNEAKMQVFYWLVDYFVNNMFNEKLPIFNDLHRIFDSAVDADRLDYFSRDMINSGFSIGHIEYDRLISSMILVKTESGFEFCPSVTTLNNIEDFFQRRWQLYKYLILHHRVVKTDKLLEKVLVALALDYLSKSIPVEPGDPEKQALPIDISGLWLAVKEALSNKKYFNALIQWDDAWLLTVLRKEFFEYYHLASSVTKYQMEELLSNKKYYRSMIKRMDAFLEIDREVAKDIIIDPKKLLEKIEHSWKPLIEKLEQQTKDYYKEFSLNGFFILSLKNFFLTIGQENEFYNRIEKEIKEMTTSCYGAKDCLVVFNKKVKTGIDNDTPQLYQNGSLVKLEQVSKIKSELLLNQRTFPLFYVYVMEDSVIDHKEYLKSLAEAIKKAINSLFEMLQSN